MQPCGHFTMCRACFDGLKQFEEAPPEGDEGLGTAAAGAPQRPSKLYPSRQWTQWEG